jgi:hypothetical protein
MKVRETDLDHLTWNQSPRSSLTRKPAFYRRTMNLYSPAVNVVRKSSLMNRIIGFEEMSFPDAHMLTRS